MGNETCLILIINFQHLNLIKLAEMFAKCEMEMRLAPPQFPCNLDTDQKPEVVLA